MPHNGSQPIDLTGQAVMGADYTKTPPELHVLSTDSTGALIVDASGGTGNSAAGPTGAPVPADADYIGFNLAGNLVGVSAANPLPVSVTAIVSDTVNQGTQGTIASSWYVEITNGTTVLGTPTNPIRIDPTGTTVQPVSIQGTVPVSGTVTTQVTQGTRQAVSFTSSTPADTSNTIALVAYANVAVTLHYSGTVTGGQMFFEISDDNSNWYGITMAPTDDTPTGAAVTNFPVDNYTLSSAAGNISWQMFVGGYAYFRVRMHIQVVGSGTAIVAVIPSTAACDPSPQVTQGITPWVVDGNLTHNNAAPASTNVGALTAIANAAPPSFTEGDQVLLTTDLSGHQRVVGPVSTTTTAAPASTSVTSTSSSLLSANSLRLEFSVVNTGTVAVYLAFNTRTPTATAYSIALSPCTTANDGTGGTFTSDLIKGSVSAITASTSGTVCVTEYVA